MATSKIKNPQRRTEYTVSSVASESSVDINVSGVFRTQHSYLITFIGSYANSVGGAWLLMIGNNISSNKTELTPLHELNIELTLSLPDTLIFTNNYSSPTSSACISIQEV